MSRLRVALDARMLQEQPLGGVGRYLLHTIPTLAEHAEVLLLVDGRRAPPRADLDGRVELVALRAPRGVPGLGWLELAVAPWLRRFDGIFHATFNTLPLSWRGRSVLTLHDLAPQVHAEDFGRVTRAAWRVYVRASVARATVIATPSEFIRGQMVNYFGLDRERVRVVPNAVDPVFDPGRESGAPALARSLGLVLPYIAAVGGPPRRGLPLALDAWRELRRASPVEVGLAVVGQSSLTPEPGLVALGRIDDEAWATVLAGARALCYPTRYEGFGMPGLEAMGSGTPVVCNPVASLPEVLGDAACWSPAPTAQAMAGVLLRLMSDDDWHRERRSAGLARAQSAPTFDESAIILLEAYERAAA